MFCHSSSRVNLKQRTSALGIRYAGFVVNNHLSFLPPDDCDFETIDMCGYTQDQSDTFDWTRSYGSTVSIGTGPTADHTYGTKTGL